jgi:hypothetical protein
MMRQWPGKISFKVLSCDAKMCDGQEIFDATVHKRAAGFATRFEQPCLIALRYALGCFAPCSRIMRRKYITSRSGVTGAFTTGKFAAALESLDDLCDINALTKSNMMRRVTGKEVNLRMGKKITLLSGIMLFALTLTFAGCGKKEEPAPPPPPPAESAAPAAEATAPAGGEQKAEEPKKDEGMEKKDEGMEKKDEGKTK